MGQSDHEYQSCPLARNRLRRCCSAFPSPALTRRAPEDPDPPGRAGRLSLVQGDVSLQPAGAQDWANAVVNRPLTTGDRLWSDQDGRAEVQVGPATVRLGSTPASRS